MSMYCMHCGTPNSDSAKFCRSCGKPLEEPVVSAVEENEETVPLGDVLQEEEQPSYGTAEPSYGGQPPYGTAEPPYGGRTPYGTAEPSHGGQPPYGTAESPYGGQPPYENQPSYGAYGNQPSYGNSNTSYGGQPPYGTAESPYGGQAYGNPPSYGTYGNPQSYGTPPSYGQPGYAQNPYGYDSSYGMTGEKKQKKKGKKGVVIAVIVVLLAALLGGGAFLYIKASDPMAPVDSFFDGLKDGDWNQVYDSIYWGDQSSSGWMSKEEFVQEAEDSMGDISYMSGVLEALKFEKVSEEEPYETGDGLTRKKITVKMSVTFMGMNESQEMDLIVVKTGKKFLFMPTWKIDNESMDELF